MSDDNTCGDDRESRTNRSDNTGEQNSNLLFNRILFS
jgi:hypothetical protein